MHVGLLHEASLADRPTRNAHGATVGQGWKAVTKSISTDNASTAKSSLRGIGLAITNMGLAMVFFLFAYGHAVSFLEQPRLSVLLIVITESIVAVLLLVRRDPDETSHTWQAWITTTGGTFAPFLLRPTDVSEDLLVGQILQIAGALVQIGALAALNRSLGLLPAHRGIKSDGLYRFVRHPLYSAYILTFAGYLVSNLSVYNTVIVAATATFMVMRIRCEEDLLRQYPLYASYANRTRWGLIPFVW
jgi:protein-S-isoprenylcysteine O-methyltransferase Ste14